MSDRSVGMDAAIDEEDKLMSIPAEPFARQRQINWK